MLGLIKRILTGNKKKQDSEQDLILEDKSPNPNFITDSAKIVTLLKDIEQQTPLCTISFHGTDEQFTTTILEVQENKGIILIDDLSPRHVNECIKKIHSLKVSALCNNIHLAFKLSGITAGNAGGIAYYKATFPKRIFYPQRRATHRIFTQTSAIAFQSTTSKSLSIGGILANISHGGIGVIVPDHRVRLKVSEMLTNCRINLPDNSTVCFDLSIRFAKSIRSNTKINFGGYFKNISARDQNKLEHFIALLERENIRKLKA